MSPPVRKKEEQELFLIKVDINGQVAIALLDSGCTTDAVSPELAKVANLNIHDLDKQVPLQLGTKGSQSRINYGMKACLTHGPLSTNEYFDVVEDGYSHQCGLVDPGYPRVTHM
jgi:hypothetical protein